MGQPGGNSLLQPAVRRMIRRRALTADIEIGRHNFRATGITAYLNAAGWKLPSKWPRMNYPNSGLFDRRSDEISLDEVERIGI